jgi:hypothetical protein
MQRFELNDNIYRSRPEWHTYGVSIEKRVPLTQRIIIDSWEFPNIMHNGAPVNQLAVTITSNLGTMDVDPSASLQHRSSVLSGSGVKQIIFNRGENGWVPVNGVNSLNYQSKSMNFNFKLRMAVPNMGIVNVPLNPKHTWKLDVTIA